jgi:predicted metal-dependent phosphoesterase TrpH
LIDLHLHTTASDGRSTPEQLVAQAVAAGATVIAVTDHDTIAACADVQRAAAGYAIETVTGIEITAVDEGRDVHMLAYFVDTQAPSLTRFLVSQREIRVARVHRIAGRLSDLGLPVDMAGLNASVADARRSVGRPQVADAMIAAGYVATRREAFDLWLGGGRPAFVARGGASPEEVIAVAHEARGLVSLAHPGRTLLSDGRVRQLVAAGLDALEVYHSDHDASLVSRYGAFADELGVLRTGGSDFHGDPSYGVTIGGASLPHDHWERLRSRGTAT